MEKTIYYDLNTISMIMGVTTRTLRNYIQLGLLKGEKINGKWQFDAKTVEKFLMHPYIVEELKIKSNSVVIDYLNQPCLNDLSCFVMDLAEDKLQPILPKIIELINQESNVRFQCISPSKYICRLCIVGTPVMIGKIIELLS